MQPNEELQVLILHDDQNEANRLASLLRNAKYKTQTTYTDDPKALIRLLEDRTFDLILSHFESEKVSGKILFPALRRMNFDLPVIQVCNDRSFEKMTESMKLGAYAAVPIDEDQLLLQVISRILYNLSQRRRLRYWRRRFAESENRCERLLDNSRDAIAIIQDGTYVYANEAYAKLFGIGDPDNMICLPVIDTINATDHAQIKELLKPQEPEKESGKQLITFNGVTPDKTPIPVECQVSYVEFQHEPALEFLIPMHSIADSDYFLSSSTPENGAPIQRHRTLEHIDIAIYQAATHGNLSSLAYINIDRYHDLQDEIGYLAMEQLVIKLIKRLEDNIDEAHSIDRFKEESLILLLKGKGIDHAVQLAEHLCEVARKEPIIVDDQTFDITLSIGISGISEAVTAPQDCIFRCLQAITELQETHKQGNYGNGVKVYDADTKGGPSSLNVEQSGAKLLENDQFDLFYQPIITLHGEPSELYEVLLRVSPDGNPDELPQDFIDQLFRTDVAGKIDRWVILESVKMLSEKIKKYPNTRLFINLSGTTICDKSFLPWLKVALRASNLSPKQLIFQIREIDMGRYQVQAARLIDDLAALHSRTALSHFGLAIDPLQMLTKADFDFVKFDSTIIAKAKQSGDNQLEGIEELLVGLKQNKKKIIIPHVESASMLPSLWHHGIDYIQGHFVQAPSAKMDFDFKGQQ